VTTSETTGLDKNEKTNTMAVHDWSDRTLPQEKLWHALPVLCLLFITGLFLRALPIMQYAPVGGDAFIHLKFAMALLNGRLSVPLEVNDASTTVELYYPPVFHLATPTPATPTLLVCLSFLSLCT
jgi:hypothetical protein